MLAILMNLGFAGSSTTAEADSGRSRLLIAAARALIIGIAFGGGLLA